MKHARPCKHPLLTAFIALALAGLLVGVAASAIVTGVVIDAHTNQSRP